MRLFWLLIPFFFLFSAVNTHPTAMPSAAPSHSPTASPTQRPTAELILKDCYDFCNISTGAVRPIAPDTPIALVQITGNFTLRFAVRALQQTMQPNMRASIIDLRDDFDGSSLLAVYMTEAYAVELRYLDMVVVDFSDILAENSSDWTIVTISVDQAIISISSIYNSGAVAPLSSVKDTYGHLYKVYVSNALDPSSGGYIRDMELSGKPYANFSGLVN
jgi:hypothetical protein